MKVIYAELSNHFPSGSEYILVYPVLGFFHDFYVKQKVKFEFVTI